MASKPTHNAMIVTGVQNEGQDNQKEFHSKVGVAWVKDIKIGTVITAQFDSFPTKTDTVTFFPIKDKPAK